MNLKGIFLPLLSFVFQLLLPVVIFGVSAQSLLLEPDFYIAALEKNNAYSSLYAMLPQEYSSALSQAMLKDEVNKLLASSVNFLNGRKETFDYKIPIDGIVNNIPDCSGRETIDLTKSIPNCLPPSLDRNVMKQQLLKSLPSGSEALKPFEANLNRIRKNVIMFNEIFFFVIAAFIAVTMLIIALNLKSPEGLAKWLGYNLFIGGILLGLSAYFMPDMAAAAMSSVPASFSGIVMSIIKGLSESVLIYSAAVAFAGAVIKFVLPLVFKNNQ